MKTFLLALAFCAFSLSAFAEGKPGASHTGRQDSVLFKDAAGFVEALSRDPAASSIDSLGVAVVTLHADKILTETPGSFELSLNPDQRLIRLTEKSPLESSSRKALDLWIAIPENNNPRFNSVEHEIDARGLAR